MNSSHPTQRFSSRVDDYVKYRPHYPREVIDVLRREIGFRPEHVVADIGSGTGISSALFLQNGNDVFAIEPNAQMRVAAERWLGNEPDPSLAGFASDCGASSDHRRRLQGDILAERRKQHAARHRFGQADKTSRGTQYLL